MSKPGLIGTRKAATNVAVMLLLASTFQLHVAADDFPLKKVGPLTWIVDYEPFWSPDGRQIVLISSRHGGMKVHTLDANSSNHGSDMRQLTYGDAEDDTPSWSPDGKMRQLRHVSCACAWQRSLPTGVGKADG